MQGGMTPPLRIRGGFFAEPEYDHRRSEQEQRDTQHLAHGENPEEIPNLLIRLPEKFHKGAEQAVQCQKGPEDDPRGRLGTACQPDEKEQNRTLEDCLVELGRMAGLGACVGKDDAPRHIGNPTVQLSVDEVAEPPEPQSDGGGLGYEVCDLQEGDLFLACEPESSDNGAGEPAVERHSPFPHRENLDGVGKIEGKVVKQGVPESGAQDQPDRQIENQVRDVVHGKREAFSLHVGAGQKIGGGETDDIHETVPAELERSDTQENRVDVGELHENFLWNFSYYIPVNVRPVNQSGRYSAASHYTARGERRMSTDDKKVIYTMMGVSKFYDKRQVLKDISLSYFYGAKIGVLGLNGSGKSSLLRILAGVDKDFIGKTILSSGMTVGFLEQEPRLDPEKTVREVVEEGVQGTVDLMNEFNRINERFAEPMSDDEMAALCERQAEVQEKLDAVDAWDLDSRLEMAMDALRCPPPETNTATLSGGEKRRVALCRLLLQQPDILLLDEPTNHLDAESVAWLEHHLQRYPGTIIAVTHDRYFLDNVAGWILELDRGEGIPWKGNYSSWLEQKEDRLRREEKSESERRKTLQRELEWIRMSPKGRHAKGKARITSYEELLGQEGEKRARDLEIYIPPGPRLGKVVVEAEGVSKGYGDRLLVEDMSFTLPPGGIVGVIGPNGAGKTTLFRMITGQEAPDSGVIRVGDTVKLAYVDQSRDALDPEKSIWEVISDGQDTLQLGNRQVNSRAYTARFNFSGADQQKKVGMLSGGERNRVHLARMLKEGANVLLLDEPTNDLDVNTMRALEEALENFGGCAVVISHDRWFLDRIATHILAFEGDSKTVWFEGNWSEYEEDRRARLGAAADQPHRIKYRQLTR